MKEDSKVFLLILISCNYVIKVLGYANITSLTSIQVNNSALTVTALQFNPTGATSDWIDRIFGSKSIYYPIRSYDKIMSSTELSTEEIQGRTAAVRAKFEMPTHGLWPACSFEILGYGLLDVEIPLKASMRHIGPSFGRAWLSIPSLNDVISCYYRAIYENWRFDTQYTSPNFWAVVFYCPAKNKSICSKLGDFTTRSSNGPLAMDLTMQLEKSKWTSHFSAKLLQPTKMDFSDPFRHANLGICLAIPYTSNDDEKSVANGAMLHEWVRYYLKLGYKIFIYDRDGANYQYIFNGQQSVRDRIPDELFNNVVYYGFTIRGLLDPSSKGVKYDNTELSASYVSFESMKSRRTRFESQGHDKTQTLTHCRFEAKALFGLDNIVVADFDEFLYCPAAGATAKGQSQFQQKFFHFHRKQGVDQITFPQRFVANTTESTRDCVVSKTNNKQSLFDCFGPYEYYAGSHSVKSIHLGHKCPLTGYHQSCSTAEVPRSYDCLCVNKGIRNNPWRPLDLKIPDRDCAFVHLSTNKANYVKYSFTEKEIQAIRSSPNELLTVLNS